MKKAIILALVLTVVFSSHLFSETLDSQQSFELGKIDAEEEHKFWRWYFLGVGSVFAALSAANTIDSLLFSGPGYRDSGWASALSLGVATVVLATPFVPASLFPKRENISPSSSGVDLESYRDGYRKTASRRNSRALVLGELTVVAGIGVVMIVFMVSFSGGF